MNRPTRVVAGLAAVLIAVPVAAAAQDLPTQTADARGEQYFLNQEGTHYVRSAQEAAKPYAQLDASQQERAVAVADAAVAGLIDSGVIRDQPADQPTDAPAPENAPEEPLGAEDVDPSVEAPVANGLIKYPPVLTLDGNTYFLNKDGHTFVADVTRVNADVTPEEAATSEALVSANTGEVGRQGLEAARAGAKRTSTSNMRLLPAVLRRKPVRTPSCAPCSRSCSRPRSAPRSSRSRAAALSRFSAFTAVGRGQTNGILWPREL